jgi:hypothetical protein
MLGVGVRFGSLLDLLGEWSLEEFEEESLALMKTVLGCAFVC